MGLIQLERGMQTVHADTKTRRLSQLVRSPELSFLIEAHDALSAAIAERTGFKGIWASGLSISSTLGYRDANEASWTQVVDTVERMADNASIPILVDGDSGFGNFNNARIAAYKLWQRGAAGVCLEDKQFPKMNSFVGNRHPLAEVREFCGRLRAVKDAIPDRDFVLVARLEALIAGYDMAEALDRAHAYVGAGADAILIHSRKSVADEIVDFARLWGNVAPVVIVPTKYYKTPTSVYREAGISTVIWANHSMRAAVAAMAALCRRIHDEESIASIESGVASLEDIFQLLRYDELSAAERTYFGP
ncbi:MAG TPA: phosphoenolpyruvate mutase [Stellaceae bacterium]|nr:phosphoenolpyruvate mutase [Stellaceae bacterium]